MTHHHEEEKNYDYIYYLVGLISGLFVGVVIDAGFIWIPILGIFGLLFTAFFIKLLVQGRERA
ncbi:MAG: hypothetical protein JWQ63_4485 [Mucilaginibacter sp.]|jgi:hypothetical protein|nr:hypothetical protein [Mucilaginibacter sp.]